MDGARKLETPLTSEAVRSLTAGQETSISGVIYTARDMAHKKLCGLIDSGGQLPFELEGSVIYFVGPSPARPGQVIGAAGPTTSSRMDAFSPRLIENGLKGMIGKGYRSGAVRDALKEYGAVHFATIGGAGALLSRHIVASEAIAFEELGTEAVRRLEVVDFPAIVAYDAHGSTVYDE